MKKSKTYRCRSDWSGKPYNFFGDYLHNRYSCRVLKLPVNAGFSCPNRDGKTGTDGCVFCSEDGSASPTTGICGSIKLQMQNAVKSFKRSDRNTKYIAYLQAFTNTYASTELLKKIYDESVSFPGITGLMIGTRPDCLDNEILELISSYRDDNFELWIELGAQTIHNRSLEFLGRGHTAEQTFQAIYDISKFDINICAHVILGIPGESWNDMMGTAVKLSSLPLNGIKIHQLHVIKNTPLERMYRENHYQLLSMKEYTSIVCDFLERTRPDITVHRLMGDRDEKSLVAPAWGLHKGTVIKSIEDEFAARGTYQGFLVEEEFV